MNIDLLLVNPSTNYILDQEYISSRRIEDDMPNQESPPLGIGYMLAVAKNNGFNAKFINMVIKQTAIDWFFGVYRSDKDRCIGRR